MNPAARHVWRETLISVVINMALSLVFFLIVFGRTDPVAVWGVGQFAFDFLPQSFMIALMATMVPGALTARQLRTGRVKRLAGRTRLPSRLLPRALLLALLATVVGSVTVALVLLVTGQLRLDWHLALMIKLLYGGALALLITPIGLKAALRAP